MLGFQQLLHHELGVADAAGQLLAAAELVQQGELVGAELSLLVDVRHGAHQRAQDQLGVILKEGAEEENAGSEIIVKISHSTARVKTS